MKQTFDKALNLVVGCDNDHAFSVAVVDGYPTIVLTPSGDDLSDFSRDHDKVNIPETVVISFRNLGDFRALREMLRELDNYPMLETLFAGNIAVDNYIEQHSEERLITTVEDRDRATEIIAFNQEGVDAPNLSKLKCIVRSTMIARFGDLGGQDDVKNASKYIGE